MAKNVFTHIQHKRGTEAEWNSSSYIAPAGELIIYLPDASHTKPRFKVGNGVKSGSTITGTMVKNLPFTESEAAALTDAEIDEICGANISAAEGVSF